MISAEAIRRGYNHGRYTVGAPTTPGWAVPDSAAGETSLQTDPVVVPAEVLAELGGTGAEVVTGERELIDGTRDWWARSMIAETSGNPVTPVGAIARVDTEQQVTEVLRIASREQIPVTASAGRSNVTGAALPLRGGIVLDLCALNEITDLDTASQIVEVQAGMFGDVFEQQLQEQGFTTGHWPSSFGLSTVGGWVACRGAGQLSTRYGKVEDMVVGLDVVLSDGTEISLGHSARAAVGPDLRALFIGSEGTLGVITRVRLQVHRLPDYARAFAYGFATFADGLEACREIMQRGATPAALRLYDELESGLQFDLPDTNVLLVADEGPQRLVDAGLEIAEEVCAETGTRLDGDAIFERWLESRMVTGKSAEGFTADPGFVSDTLEMTGRWRDLPAIYDEVVQALKAVPGTLAGSAHQSHAYVTDGCLYFSLRGKVEPDRRAEWYRAAWDAANAVVLRHGATLSHHHGVGLLRAPYMRESLGGSFALLETIKRAVDPDDLLNPGKLGL